MRSNASLGLNTLLGAGEDEDVALSRILRNGFWLWKSPKRIAPVLSLHPQPKLPSSQGEGPSTTSASNFHSQE